MRWLLDTNICVYIIKKRPDEVIKRFASLTPGDVAISSLTQFELLYGAINSTSSKKNLALLEDFFLPLEILDFDQRSAEESAKIRYELKHSPIGPIDTLLAGQARAHSLILVTNNTSEFSRVVTLQLENWVLRKVK